MAWFGAGTVLGALVGGVALAVDSSGRLRFKNVTFWAASVGGKVVLDAQSADGRLHQLAAA